MARSRFWPLDILGRRRISGGGVPLQLSIVGTAWAQLVLLAIAAVRGLDYLFPDEVPTGATKAALSIVDQTLPLPVWGAFLVGGVVLVGIGAAISQPYLVIAGHALCGGAYTGVGVGQTLVAAETLPMGWTDPNLPAIVGGLLAAAIAVNVARDQPRIHWPTIVLIGTASFLVVSGLLTLAIVGDGFRTGVGLIGGGFLHTLLALAANRIARVDRSVVEEE